MSRPKQIYTEFRVTHKSQEDKEDFETNLNEALKENRYGSKVEWIKEKYRELIEKRLHGWDVERGKTWVRMKDGKSGIITEWMSGFLTIDRKYHYNRDDIVEWHSEKPITDQDNKWSKIKEYIEGKKDTAINSDNDIAIYQDILNKLEELEKGSSSNTNK